MTILNCIEQLAESCSDEGIGPVVVSIRVDSAADRWSSLPLGRAVGSVPWLPMMWHPDLEQEKAVESYLSGKSGAEQMALARMMREVETGCLPPARSRTVTPELKWLQQPGAGRIIALAWNARLAEGSK